MAESGELECAVCYNEVRCDDEAEQLQGTARRSKLCSRCCVCEDCVGAWVKKRCLTASADTDLRCPCCMNTVDASVWLEAVDETTMGFLNDKFREKFQVVCDENCNHEFSVWRPAVQDVEAETRSLLNFIKARPVSGEVKMNVVKACRKFGNGKATAEDVVHALQAVCEFDQDLVASIALGGWGTGVSFPQLVRNPMKRVKILEALLEENTKVSCEACSSEICFRCWRSYHGEGNMCHRVHTRECPGCGVTIERTGGGPHLTCSLCQHSFYWHDGMYHEDPDYFAEDYGAAGAY